MWLWKTEKEGKKEGKRNKIPTLPHGELDSLCYGEKQAGEGGKEVQLGGDADNKVLV